MGYNEQWGSLASRFAEAGIVEGLVPYRKAAGQLALSKGVVRLKSRIGQMHVRSLDFQVGDLVAAVVADQDTVIDTGALNPGAGYYRVYAQPVLDRNATVARDVVYGDGDMVTQTPNPEHLATTGFELHLGGALLVEEGGIPAASMAQALEGFEPGAARTVNAVAGVQVPEENYDASAFKMVVAVPDQDFYKGRSIEIATVQLNAAGDILAIDCTRAHRVR